MQPECDWSPQFDFIVPANLTYCPTPPSPIEISSSWEGPPFGCGTCEEDDLEGSNYTLDTEERSKEEDSAGSLEDFIVTDTEVRGSFERRVDDMIDDLIGDLHYLDLHTTYYLALVMKYAYVEAPFLMPRESLIALRDCLVESISRYAVP